jgi:hypothetical protein
LLIYYPHREEEDEDEEEEEEEEGTGEEEEEEEEEEFLDEDAIIGFQPKRRLTREERLEVFHSPLLFLSFLSSFDFFLFFLISLSVCQSWKSWEGKVRIKAWNSTSMEMCERKGREDFSTHMT